MQPILKQKLKVNYKQLRKEKVHFISLSNHLFQAFPGVRFWHKLGQDGHKRYNNLNFNLLLRDSTYV